MTEYFDDLETQAPEQRSAQILTLLQQQFQHAKTNSKAYAKLFEGISEIKDFADFASLPITRKSEMIAHQKQQRPLGGFDASQPVSISHIFASPGPIYEPGFNREDYWRFARTFFAAGFRAGELIHNTFSYHMVPAGMMVDSGARALGCRVIPAGTGQTDLQLQTIADLKPNGYVGTPSFLKILLEKAEQQNINVSSITHALVSGEALPGSIRDWFSERGIQVQQCYATADLGVIGYESDSKEGLIIDEGVYVEIVRPGSGDPVVEGEVGEVVVTLLSPEYPLIRFATGDLSAALEGQSRCGRTNMRIKGWMGRADQTTKVRGMFIHPEQVDKVVKRHPEIVKARLVVDWVNQADQLALHCEIESVTDDLIETIKTSTRDICKIRAEVVVQNIGTLANDGKVIDDIRQYD